MEAGIKKKDKDPGQGRLEITLINEDDGREYELHGGRGERVRKLIDEVYVKIGRERQADDRLRCKGGDDVFSHAESKLGDYVAKHCRSRTWLFSSPTGGA